MTVVGAPGPPLLSMQGLPPPNPRFCPRGCRPRTPASFPGATAPGPRFFPRGYRKGSRRGCNGATGGHARMRMRLPAAATCRHWSPAAATWFPQAPQYARGFWPQVAAGGTKWRRVATSCIGPRAALVCVCAFEPPPLVATGRFPPPLAQQDFYPENYPENQHLT